MRSVVKQLFKAQKTFAKWVLYSAIKFPIIYYACIEISNIIHMYFPELIILNGPVYTNLELFYEVAVKTATKRCKSIHPNHEIIFSKGNLGENAVAIGAGRTLLEVFFKERHF